MLALVRLSFKSRLSLWWSYRMGGTVILVGYVCWIWRKLTFFIPQYLWSLSSVRPAPILRPAFSLKWVESDPDENGFGGGGGAKWVDVDPWASRRSDIDGYKEHIDSWANIAGSLLGILIRGDARHGRIGKHSPRWVPHCLRVHAASCGIMGPRKGTFSSRNPKKL